MSQVKNCEDCGMKISLRKMPHGKWVAFDWQTDQPHVCKCRFCGKKVDIRVVPAGHKVAFNLGTGQFHMCYGSLGGK